MKIIYNPPILFGLFYFTFLLLNANNSYANSTDSYNNRLEIEVGWVDLDGEARRLRENHFGEYWENKFNLQTSLSSLFKVNKHVAFYIEPVLIEQREGEDFFLRKGYLRATMANLVLKVGRESLWWGPGRHGSLIVSNNAAPFDLIQLASDSPFRLPGFLSGIGDFSVTAFLTKLESNRDWPRTPLLGLRIGYQPSDQVSLGMSRVTMFNGEGRPQLTLLDFLELYVSDPNITGIDNKYDVNEIAGLDINVAVPLGRFLHGHQMQVYLEYAGEDEAGFLPSRGGIVTGMRWGSNGRELTLEYADNHVTCPEGCTNYWYNHHVYTSGYTYRREVIGHHMGTDADDIFIRATSALSEKWVAGIDFDKERHGLSSPVQEKLSRWGGDIVFHHTPRNSYSFRYQSERIDNLNNASSPVRLELSSRTVRNQYGIVSVVRHF